MPEGDSQAVPKQAQGLLVRIPRVGVWQWVRRLCRRSPADLFNLVVEPAYAIKASARNPYFQGLERLARDAGLLGSFVVEGEGTLRAGSREGLPTRHARLMLDVYPNPAAVEGRAVSNYGEPHAPRRVPRATLVLDDDSELLLWFEGTRARVAGEAIHNAEPMSI